MLETYFMNLDNTYNKLQTLSEYIDDTEDYVRFEIDTQRNRFIEVSVALLPASSGRSTKVPHAHIQAHSSI